MPQEVLDWVVDSAVVFSVQQGTITQEEGHEILAPVCPKCEEKVVYKEVEKIVYVDREVPVEKIVYVDREVPVEKIVYVDREVEKIVYVDKPYEVEVEKIVYKDTECSE